MIKTKDVVWILFFAIWFANINDLIRGTWFYPTTASIIFWNVFGLIAFLSIYKK